MIAECKSDDIPPQMKILNEIIPILMASAILSQTVEMQAT